MSKKPKLPQDCAPLKRKSSKPDLCEEKPKKVKLSAEDEEGEPLLTKKELSKRTGLSEFMLNVAMDILSENKTLTLIDIVCPHEEIVVLNKEVVDLTRPQCVPSKKTKTKVKTEETPNNTNKKKVYKDDEVRRFIVEKHDKLLQSQGVRIAGTTLIGKMDNAHKDDTLVSEFLGYARTPRNYFVYAFYVGPLAKSAADLSNPQHWLPVHKNSLPQFHKRIKDYKPYLRQTNFDQVENRKNGTPQYDPRFIVYRWLAKEGQAHRATLLRHRALFKEEKDFVTKHYDEKDAGALHYYEEGKPDCLLIDLSMDVESGGGLFNVEQDRLRQQATGYRLTDKEVCHVSIEEFPSLSRTPLPQEIDLSWDEFLGIRKHLHVDEKKRIRPPEDFICDPLVMVKAAMMALNLEMLIRRVPPIVGDAKLQILEADNMKPILDYLGSHTSCTDAIKEATFKSILAFMATEAMTRELPPHIVAALDRAGKPELVLLDS